MKPITITRTKYVELDAAPMAPIVPVVPTPRDHADKVAPFVRGAGAVRIVLDK